LIPPGHGPELSLLFGNIHMTWTGFLRGQIHLMLIVGLVTWVGGFILGLPQAFFLGVIAGFMELIPNVGPVLAAVPAVLIALLFGSTHLAFSHLSFTLVVIGFYTLVQMLENQFLVPKIMGNAVDLPPLIVLIGVIAGAEAFGIMGALLATPMIATGKLIFRYIYGKIMEDTLVAPPVRSKPNQ
jgi:predicted PurR-regulated permease PerM